MLRPPAAIRRSFHRIVRRPPAAIGNLWGGAGAGGYAQGAHPPAPPGTHRLHRPIRTPTGVLRSGSASHQGCTPPSTPPSVRIAARMSREFPDICGPRPQIFRVGAVRGIRSAGRGVAPRGVGPGAWAKAPALCQGSYGISGKVLYVGLSPVCVLLSPCVPVCLSPVYGCLCVWRAPVCLCVGRSPLCEYLGR